ncbi:MAG: 16S rRNA (cytosine(1402)-N(4))-methyltransferase, partial [Verrucomicrobia bacterium]|nr:16S rRNA (cytosine(1402)-N(4))-methyltransferase [Verrucomicrobiota bacterium]
PLDMRQDQRQTLTAAELVNTTGVEIMSSAISALPGGGGMWHAIRPRCGSDTNTGVKTMSAFESNLKGKAGILTGGSSGFGFEMAKAIVARGGRLAVITFHSLEDRMVKVFGRQQCRDYAIAGDVDAPEFRQPRRPEMQWLQRKAFMPSAAEVAANPRSRSAQLRVLQKV